jgi:hypothetical protein
MHEMLLAKKRTYEQMLQLRHQDRADSRIYLDSNGQRAIVRIGMITRGDAG